MTSELWCDGTVKVRTRMIWAGKGKGTKWVGTGRVGECM